MSNDLIETIISQDEAVRSRSITSLLRNKSRDELIESAEVLESFRLSSENLYHKVRASLFLHVTYRYYLASYQEAARHGGIPFEGIKAAFNRDFEESVRIYHNKIRKIGDYNGAICSAIADSYHKLSFKYLLDQVKRSISHCSENYSLYNMSSLDEYPFSVPREMTSQDTESGLYPVGVDAAPVRLDPSHSGWSDIFFLGMDFPEGARVVNVSVNLRIHGTGDPISPPCECYCRFIEEPVITLASIDLKTSKKITTLKELFNFGNDYLSLLKAGVVASGIVPPCFEYSDILLKDLLLKLLNKKGGVEIVTRVHNIPKGSRLAVSTTLLATIITRLMRFSGQIHNQTGPIDEADRRVVASRAILGEWLGGSGGGWQDSGGLWPGIKVITGKLAEKGNPEFGVSRGCLLPEHTVFNREEIGEEVETKILSSIVLVHGGISQDVGPILEMVTEKYLLKYDKEWNARLRGIDLFDDIVKALKTGDMREVGRLVSIDWESVIQDIVPWVNNAFTDDLIHKAKSEFMEDYWGFLMLGGMSGGGMAFIVNPSVRDRFKERIADIMNDLKNTYARSLPFIIDPVVYDFDINHEGIIGRILSGKEAVLPVVTYPDTDNRVAAHADLDEHSIRNRYGFDRTSHDHIKNALKGGKIGLIQNRMSMSTSIEDVEENAIYHFESGSADKQLYDSGLRSLMNNEVAVITFAGGTGSRWTHGAAVVKPINPFVKIYDAYRSFIEIHLSKSTKTGELSGQQIPHAFTTSYLTHDAIAAYLKNFDYFGQKERVYLSQGKSIGLRVYPMERDLRFYWHEQLQQKMDDNVQKVQDAQHNALIEWARSRGEGEDYAENRPVLRFNPPGHWYEIPNLIKNGVLAEMIHDNPGLTYLLCHNIDTLGAYIEPALLGMHIKSGSCMMCEVTPRRFEDAGGGLAKVDGHIQLVEGLALPREEDEFRLSYYNTLTNWITIDSLLDFFGLNRDIILEAKHSPEHQNHIIKAIQHREKQVPTYVTIKNVKYLWGSGQEDVYPVAQFEKLWGDMTGLKDIKVSYVSVSRYRGLQLKEPALLDMWANDGSLDYIIGKCAFQADTAKSKNCTF